MAFAILRTEKIKTAGNAGGLCRHLERTMEVPNADPDLQHLNERRIGSKNLWHDIERRLSEQKITPRKNAVLGIEHLITYSPEWTSLKKVPNEKGDGFSLQGKSEEIQKMKTFFKEAQDWLNDQYGKENVVSVHLHMDESTPHMHAVVVPIDRKGKLNCREFLGGREKLRAMQTSFADRVRHLDLQRGMEGSKAQHVTLKEFYSLAKQAHQYIKAPEPYLKAPSLTGVKIDTPSKWILNPEKWAKAQEQKANAAIQEARSQFSEEFQSKTTEIKSYVEKSILKQFKETLELKGLRGRQNEESRLKAKYEGENKKLSTRLDLLERALDEMGLHFNYQSKKLEKGIAPDRSQKKPKLGL